MSRSNVNVNSTVCSNLSLSFPTTHNSTLHSGSNVPLPKFCNWGCKIGTTEKSPRWAYGVLVKLGQSSRRHHYSRDHQGRCSWAGARSYYWVPNGCGKYYYYSNFFCCRRNSINIFIFAYYLLSLLMICIEERKNSPNYIAIILPTCLLLVFFKNPWCVEESLNSFSGEALPMLFSKA